MTKKYSVIALLDLVRGLETALVAMLELDECAEITADGLEQALCIASGWHPEPDVGRSLQHEIYNVGYIEHVGEPEPARDSAQ
jgi:hypothetical protein